MSSQLATIIKTLAEQPVTIPIDGSPKVITASQLNELPESVDSWRLPTRLILPVGGGRAQGQLQTFQTFKSSGQGGVLTVDWTISDIFFFRMADAGIGLIDLAPALIDYCAAYMSILGALRTSTWSVTNVSFPIIGPFEYPAGQRTYDGVQVELIIRENI